MNVVAARKPVKVQVLLLLQMGPILQLTADIGLIDRPLSLLSVVPACLGFVDCCQKPLVSFLLYLVFWLTSK